MLGSTTMHQSAQFLAANLPIPVLNPGQVAWKQLELLIGLGLTHSKKAFPSPEVGKDADNRLLRSSPDRPRRQRDVPASVAVLTATALERTGANSAADFVALTSGVTIVTSTAEAGDTQVNIRGINGARDAESSIALVVDGILKTNTAQLDQVQGTLRQVEIRKGPQGALYGRNAAAGALVLSTLKPGDAFEGAAKVSYGEENAVEATAHIAGPLGTGAGFVLSGYYRTTDGQYRNLLTNRKTVDDAEDFALDGRLVFQAGPDTEIDAKARYARFRGASIDFNASFHLPNFAAVNPAFYEDIDDHKFRYYSNIRPTNDQDSFDASIKLEHGFIGAIPVPFIFAPATGSTFGPYSPTTCDGTQISLQLGIDSGSALAPALARLYEAARRAVLDSVVRFDAPALRRIRADFAGISAAFVGV